MTFLFFAHGSLAVVQFFQIAMYWKKLAKNFSKIDNQMNAYKDPKDLSLNMKLLSFTVMTAAACKFLLRMVLLQNTCLVSLVPQYNDCFFQSISLLHTIQKKYFNLEGTKYDLEILT